ncbi:uncharacterized protein [Rutidosis leptorrhynchoides]|uniref:uncharacterized protein n=1 Tax=Rutidosis leptorrhynchoides TaxID=125765 RepID=UPI003A98E4DF
MKRRSRKDQEFTHPFSDSKKHVHGVYKRRKERVLRKFFMVLPFCLEEMNPNGQPIHNDEGNPIGYGPPVNQEQQNDPNNTPMWNTRLAAPTVVPPAITKPPIGADNWKVEGNFFTMIKDMFFHGLIEENPFEHIQHFNDICDIYKTKDVTDDAFKLRAFPFTLQGDAKAWLRNLPPDSIRTFQDLTDAFINHFFSPSKVEQLRMKINGFTQRGDESFQQSQPSKSLEEIMKNYIKKVETTEAFLLKENRFLKQRLKHQQASFQNLESTVGRLSNQVAERPHDTLPSNRQVNPSNNYNNTRQHNQNQQNNNTRVIPIESTNQNPNHPNRNENVNAITTRSGLTTQGIEDPHPHPFIIHEPLPSFIEEETEVGEEKGKEKVNSTEGTGNDETGKKKGNVPLKATRPVPYPKALKKDKLAAQYKKFQDMMKNISINLPIIDVHKGMPNYGRFIKELISQRGKYHDETSFFIEEECNKILESRLRIPKKLGDPGKFVFPCKFGESEVFNALADLGASINLMPHLLYERLGLGPLNLTRIRIRLANHSFDTAIGIAEDILLALTPWCSL